MLRKRIARISVSLMLAALMLVSAGTAVMAGAPAIEDIEHNGRGRVEVDFYGKVKYRKCRVTVRDNYGKKYKVKKIRKDSDDVNFTIKNFKAGRNYTITVKGVKTRGTKKYGRVSGTLNTAPAAAPAANIVSREQALNIAQQHAAATWGTSGFYDIRTESDRDAGTEVWDVEFKGYVGGVLYEYDYTISKNGGTILSYESEIED